MKVLLIDDHALFREGLALLLRPLQGDLAIREAGSCEQAFELLEAGEPAELVLIDLELPQMHGLQGIAALRQRWPDSIVVALSSVDDRDTVLRAIDAGAMGFIPKSATAAVLIAALRLILARGVYLPPSAFLAAAPVPHAPVAAPARPSGNTLRSAPASKALPGPPATSADDAARGEVAPADLGLTPRQSDVLFLILQGKPAKLIERELELSTSTVKAHTSAVLRALNVTTRTQAVVAAGRLGLRFGAPAAVPSAA
jgi:DNA-binding NarL/FixJ family response regulator